MLSCPNESSQEWKKILEENNGNRDNALKAWAASEYASDKDLNTPVSDDNFTDERQGQTDTLESEKADKFSKLSDGIKLYLEKQLKILEGKKVYKQTEKEKKLKKLIDNVKAAEGAESIYIFMKDAYEKALSAQSLFEKTLAKSDELSRKDLMQRLAAVADFANSYSILDEIDNRDVREYFSFNVDPNTPADKLTPQQMIADAINIRDRIRRDYVTVGIPLMADFLLGYKAEEDAKTLEQLQTLRKRLDNVMSDPKTSDAHKQKRSKEIQDEINNLQQFPADKQAMVDLLKLANSDESALDFLISPLISSEDAALALFAKAIKSQIEIARQEDVKALREAAAQKDEYAKSTTASEDNTAKFNEGIYETITKYSENEKGELEETQQMAFVQKYNISAYRKAQIEFFKNLGDKPVLSEEPTAEELNRLKLYNRKVAIWFTENTEPKPEAERNYIIALKTKERDSGIITQEEYEEWLSDVITVNKYGNTIYKKELSQPAKKYINSKWAAMYDANDQPINAKGEYHKYLTDMYFKAQEKLPLSRRPGYILPSIPKTDLERAIQNGVKDLVTVKAKEAIKVQSYDTEFGLAGLSEKGVKFIPIFYTQKMEANDVSLDLVRSVLLFNAMANRYDALNEVNAEISLFKTIIGEREVKQTNSKGQPILDAFAKKLGYEEFIRQNGTDNYSKKHVNAFIDMVVYGETQLNEELFGLSATKITNTLSGFSAITSIAADVLKGVANNLQGNIQLIIEANSGEFFNKKNLANGKGFYTKSIPSMLGDFGKSSSKSLVGMLVEDYDAIQGSFTDNYGKSVSGSVANKLFRTNTLFFNQHFGEHEIQVSTMLSLMDATKVIDNNTGEEITLLEAHEKYGAGDGVKNNTNFTEAKRQAFQNRLHALNKRMHGVYNEFDKGTAQRYSLGRLAVMYRKHLVPGYKRRFKKMSMDQELGSFTEGFYRTFWKTFVRDLRDFKFNITQNWSTYSAFEKAQIKRVIAEATIILTTTALIAILKAAVDDDDDELKKNYAYNFVLYELIRMRSETAAYISPNDAYRVVKSPSAMTSTLERAIKFSDQFFLTWDPDKLEYQRKQGIWNKGDNKSWAYFLKLMGYSGYNITPEAAVESFEGTLTK